MGSNASEAALDEPRGKQILAHATSKEYCVLEFKETDDGMVVADITDHVEALEEDAGT